MKSYSWIRTFFLAFLGLLCGTCATFADDSPTAIKRREQAREFHIRAQERTGLLVPLYVYPSNIHKNPIYNRLMDLKRQHPTVPIWVIVNPASGPGSQVDPNYVKAIDRLRGAGCVVIGYLTTSYAKRTETQVRQEIDQWLKLYPRIQGIFFDEMIYQDTEAGAAYQASVNQYAHDSGCWPTVANPGADTPGRYFEANAADVIVIHEGNNWPKEERLKGDFFGGYADHPPFTRAILLHSQSQLNQDALQMAQKYVRWIYVTDAPYQANNPKASNPWNRLPKYLEQLLESLAKTP